MTLVLDFSQNKATAALLGTGFSSSADTGNTDKKLVFAENLRQQISEAVSSSNHPSHSNLLPAEPQANNPVHVVSDQFIPVKVLPAKTGNRLQDAEPDSIAAGGMFLPLPDHVIVDQSLAWSVNAAAEASIWPSLHEINPDIGNRPELNIPGYAKDTLFNSAAVSQYLLAADSPLQNIQVADSLLQNLPIADSSLQNLPLADSPLQNIPVADSFLANLPLADSSLANLPVADSSLATPVIPDNAAVSVAAGYVKDGEIVDVIPVIDLTPAYDLSLPEVMPPITLATLSNAPSQSPDLTLLKQTELAAGAPASGQTANATPVLPNVMPLTIEKISIDKTKNHKTEMQSTSAVFELDNKNPASRQPADNNATLPDIVVDLQSKGIEPASSSSTRSAYLNTLLANLLGTDLDSPAMSGLSGDAYGQGNTLIAQNAMARTDAMFVQTNNVIPTISVLNEQSLLASVSAGSSDLSASLQGVSHYNADQRLLQAAESRFTHLQGIQQSNLSVESATSRMPGTGLPGLDMTFGQTGWVERIGQQLLLQTAQGNSIARIRIDPPELGSLTIRIQLAEQTATVNFVSPHAMVRDAIEQQSQRLQEMFNEQGLNLRNVTVSDQSPNSRQQPEGQSAGQDNADSQSANNEEQEQAPTSHKSTSLIDYYA